MLVVSVVAAGSLTACSATETVRILEAHVSDDDRAIDMGVESCNADPQFEVRETATEVRVTVRAAVSGSGRNLCRDVIVVPLADPLDGRSLIDGSNGEEVRPSRK